MRHASWSWPLVVLASFASFHCACSAPPERPPISSRGSTRLFSGAAGTDGTTDSPDAAAPELASDDTGAAEEPIPPCTALASCCATFETNDLQGFCQETLATSSPEECANAVENFGCAPQ